jgi:hypothetical protein
LQRFRATKFVLGQRAHTGFAAPDILETIDHILRSVTPGQQA